MTTALTIDEQQPFNPTKLYAFDGQGGRTALVFDDAQAKANANGAPVAVLARDGWLAICELADVFEDAVQYHGWTEVALVDPQE